MISSAMLCVQEWTPVDAVFPYLATPKIDGIRFYMAHGDVWTRSGRPMPNLFIRKLFKDLFPDGIDGEIFVNGNFTDSHSFCSSDAKPFDGQNVVIYPFDFVDDSSKPYITRVHALLAVMKELLLKGWKSIKTGCLTHPAFPGVSICPLYPNWIKDHHQFEAYYAQCLAAGHEGIIFRSPEGAYKDGRSTMREHLMMKYKPKTDRIAIVLGVEELQVNTNPIEVGSNGKPQRSKAASGMISGNTFGRFFVKDVENEVKFYVGGGPGLTDSARRILWEKRQQLPGCLIEYRCMPYGAKEGPRQPQFLSLVDEREL